MRGLKEKIGFHGLDRLAAAKEALTENVSSSPISYGRSESQNISLESSKSKENVRVTIHFQPFR